MTYVSLNDNTSDISGLIYEAKTYCDALLAFVLLNPFFQKQFSSEGFIQGLIYPRVISST